MNRLAACCARTLWRLATTLSLLLAAVSPSAHGEAADSGHLCGKNETWDNGMSMCMPVAGATSVLLSGQFNVFGVFSALQGPRGVSQFAAPDMFMGDAGKTVGTHQFINVELMGTLELWTYPYHGYPELLQIGEERSNGTPYVDAQHPHTSPVMGLTFSDTISLAGMNTLKLFFAPRGESTDGPIAYMHRESAEDDPDAPLGHHVGQDVGHISSTVFGAQLALGSWIVEASAFNGTEPQPTRVDLPLGPVNSEALRITYVISPDHRVMASVAHVDEVDPLYPLANTATRASASLYDHLTLGDIGGVNHTFVIGSIKRSPGYPSLSSFLDEAVLNHGATDVWGRAEVLQRLASELEIPEPPAVTPTNDERWVSALTIGCTHWLPWQSRIQVGVGSSLTMDVIPADWAGAYGHRRPLTFRLILQVRGSGLWRH
jgi:hypothetical protein